MHHSPTLGNFFSALWSPSILRSWRSTHILRWAWTKLRDCHQVFWIQWSRSMPLRWKCCRVDYAVSPFQNNHAIIIDSTKGLLDALPGPKALLIGRRSGEIVQSWFSSINNWIRWRSPWEQDQASSLRVIRDRHVTGNSRHRLWYKFGNVSAESIHSTGGRLHIYIPRLRFHSFMFACPFNTSRKTSNADL